ncbi:hypothetical protein CWI38_0009p0150 [Hamiltosporidium tvaerminnensis]|uniref:Macro domain-containing protein n=2 Tax=Hamiltosporidium TaxID=1176354 RepID=A0A4Q9LJE1_9MICR|nr:hypothetical protein CWI36_0200p0060 [Hamiltosporidium magnivora]TBU20925.1 hypothetical protein CWI38_0009p0150 [Hamiltosporidium tvaerminnensis]
MEISEFALNIYKILVEWPLSFRILVGFIPFFIYFVVRYYFKSYKCKKDFVIEDGKDVEDEEICIRMKASFKEYLQNQSKVKTVSFMFNEDIGYEEMGFGKEKITCLGIVNAANSEVKPGMGGLNAGITVWVGGRYGIITDQQGQKEWCDLKMLNRLRKLDPKKIGLVAVSNFIEGHVFHVVGPQACLVGTQKYVKSLSGVTETLIKAYKDCLFQAKNLKCSHIIFPLISGGIFCESNPSEGFSESEFLNAVQLAVKKFIQNADFKDIKVYFNI